MSLTQFCKQCFNKQKRYSPLYSKAIQFVKKKTIPIHKSSDAVDAVMLLILNKVTLHYVPCLLLRFYQITPIFLINTERRTYAQ